MLFYSQAQFATINVISDGHGLGDIDDVQKIIEESGGDYRICYVKDNSILFGRDIFGRKSLCGRLHYEDRKIRVEIAVGFFGEKCTDCFEFPPGTLHRLQRLTNVTAHQRSISFEIDEEYCQREELTVYTYYELDDKHPFYSVFANVKVIERDSSLYLQPCTQFDVCPSQLEVDSMADELIQRLSAAVRSVFEPKLLTSNDSLKGPPEQLSICFSGGVDSLMVTVLAAQTLTQVRQFNLINTVFGENEKGFDSGSDRIKALECFQFLTQKFGADKFSMILVNVKKDEIVANRPQIECAMLPCFTILDESLASVMWFGSRAEGHQLFASKQQGLTFKPSNCALVGSGADELLGGYARHRTVFEHGGWPALHSELQMEIGRIGARNFGRDDRIALSNGVHLLAPFISDQFVQWVNQIPLPYRVNFKDERGLGEKRLLRVALRRLGLPSHLTDTPKRAMQFGSGYAKLQNRGMKGNDRSVNTGTC